MRQTAAHLDRTKRGNLGRTQKKKMEKIASVIGSGNEVRFLTFRRLRVSFLGIESSGSLIPVFLLLAERTFNQNHRRAGRIDRRLI